MILPIRSEDWDSASLVSFDRCSPRGWRVIHDWLLNTDGPTMPYPGVNRLLHCSLSSVYPVYF